MTHGHGEDSPAPDVSATSAAAAKEVGNHKVMTDLSESTVSVSPTLSSAKPRPVGALARWRARRPSSSDVVDDLVPLDADAWEFVRQNRGASAEEVRARLETRRSVQEAAEAAGIGEAVEPEAQRGGDAHGVDEQRDDDGFIYFDYGGAIGPSRVLRLPPDVPVPSKDMIRRHRKAGHTPYMPWCSRCVESACNAPAHVARAEAPEGGFPEVHVDYAFFKDRKGEVEGKVTVLVSKDRPSGAVCADVVPKKGTGGGYAVKQLNRN